MKYESFKTVALSIKTYMQALIGVVAFFIIVAHLLEIPLGGEQSLKIFKSTHPLKVAAFALGIGASFDLLYMLMDSSLKKGFDALLIGFIAAILMMISEDIIAGWEISLTVLVLTLCMIGIAITSIKYSDHMGKMEL